MLLHYLLLKIADLRPSSPLASDLATPVIHNDQCVLTSAATFLSSLFWSVFTELNVRPCTGIIGDGVYEQASYVKMTTRRFLCFHLTEIRFSNSSWPLTWTSQSFLSVASRFPKSSTALENWNLSLHGHFNFRGNYGSFLVYCCPALNQELRR